MPILYDEAAIDLAVTKLAAELDRDYAGEKPILLGVLTGAFIFLADLCRKLTIDCDIDFVRMESYGAGTVTSGAVKRSLPGKIDPSGRHLIVIEEIIDSGYTIEALLSDLAAKNPASVKVCTLVDKRGRREVEVPVDYAGLVLDDGFLIGYGLDHGEKRRNLPYIEVL